MDGGGESAEVLEVLVVREAKVLVAELESHDGKAITSPQAQHKII